MKDEFYDKMRQIFCVLALFGLYPVHGVVITPAKSVFSVAVGSELTVNCSSQESISWSKNSLDLPIDDKRIIVTALVDDKTSDNISTLTLKALEKGDEGTYRCEGGSSKTDSSFGLRVFEVYRQTAEFEHLQDVTLMCGVNDTTNQYTYSWRKGSVPVKDIKTEGKQEFVEYEQNGTLIIRHPPRSFAGLYTCEAKFDDAGEERVIEIDVEYLAKPKVIPFEKSKNLVQEDKLTIECKVLGYPKPSVAWYKEGKEIKETEGSRYKMLTANTYNDEPMEDAKLYLESVDFDDAGTYTCMATNPKWGGFNSTQEILVRVKDKLAALWPFLGIVTEVIILCTIIFIYEKKRNKDAAEDEDANADGATPEKKSEGVRHRGSANNPRA